MARGLVPGGRRSRVWRPVLRQLELRCTIPSELHNPEKARNFLRRAAQGGSDDGLLPWMIDSKLTEAEHAAGDPKAAVAVQRRALERLPAMADAALRSRLEARLKVFEEAARAAPK